MKTIPSVRRGMPEGPDANEYLQMNIGGADVYVHSSLSEFGEVEIDTDSSFFGTRLILRGVEQQSSGGCCG